jgi:glucokinase
MNYLGIEIGGTKLQMGVGSGDGTLTGLWRGRVDVAAGPEGIRRQITAAVPDVMARCGLDRSQVKGVGIGFGGPVDDNTHSIIKSHQIDGWDNFPLARWIQEVTGWPAVLGNDADTAGLAEALFGAGRGLSPIFYITIGSGIGGGLIINGEIYRGSGRGAAEIGHLLISTRAGDRIEQRPLEEYASGWAIATRFRGDTGTAKDSELRAIEGNFGKLTAADIAQAARADDPFAQSVLNQTWLHLAEAICQTIVLLCPRRIVIGGGVALMGEKLLFEPLRDYVAARVFEPFANCYEIVPGVLGEEVVVQGAVALARKLLGGNN